MQFPENFFKIVQNPQTVQVFVDFHRFSHIVYEFRNCKKREKSRILPKRSRFLPQNETYSRKVKHAFYPEISDFHEISAVSLGLCMRWERHSRVPNAVFLPHVVPRGTMSQAQSGYRSISTSSYGRLPVENCGDTHLAMGLRGNWGPSPAV